MKIIISASKTLKKQPIFYDTEVKGELLNKNITSSLVNKIKLLDKEQMSKIMKINNKLLNNTYDLYKSYDNADEYQAISLYDGTVFKQLHIDESSLSYINNHVTILSALYGVIEPFTPIKPYRLDMHMNITDQSIYKIWSNDINNYFKNEIIINLASDEYSHMVNKEKINIIFYQLKDNRLKKISYHCKVARGKMLNYIVSNKINDINILKQYNYDGYKYSSKLSEYNNLVFIKELA